MGVRPLLVAWLCWSATAVAAPQETPEQAYQQARTAYYALKQDAARRKLRHNWLSVANRFSELAKRHPSSARAPDALFTAAELRRELSRISRVDEDLSQAMSEYARLIEAHPRHRLADDAAVALARIYLERLDRPDDARRVLTRAVDRTPKGDRVGEMRQLLASLKVKGRPSEPERPAPSATAKKEAPASRKGEKADKAGGSHAKATEPPAPAAAPKRSLLDAIAEVATPHTDVVPAPTPAAPIARPSTLAAGSHPPEPAPSRVPGGDLGAGEPGEGSAAHDPLGGAHATALGLGESGATAGMTSGGGEATDDEDGSHGHSELAMVETPPPAPAEPAPSHSSPSPAALTPPKEPVRAVTPTVVRRIVIDPGHGGHDSGALGKRGTREKDVALSISKKLGELLTAQGYEVVLTRTTDRFIPLEDRARIANEARGDLFLSIHCNSAKSRSLRGIETYTLNVSSDRYSIRLAARENSSSEEGLSDLQFILADLDTKSNTEESARLAVSVQESLVGQLRPRYPGVKDLGHKQALFYVLLGAKMPSILVETSFISHPEEEQRLASGAYQRDVARAIAEGIRNFVGDGRRLAKFD